MTLRYIGSKARMAEELATHIGNPDGGRFVDAFCGMGSVAAVAADLKWPVVLNDHLAYAVKMSAARLASKAEAAFASLGGYAAVIETLNALPGKKGFIWQEYSPASAHASRARIERRYFTEENAARIDAIRAAIFDWRNHGALNSAEETVLIADLLGAANRVANIAGTYGCFLAKWTTQGKNSLELRVRDLRGECVAVEQSIGDVKNLVIDPRDTVYLDPPYTKRQYASYYHILETITRGDAPLVEGVAGLRPWQHLASDYCYKRRALTSLTGLIRDLPARRIILSYSNEGHISLPDLEASLTGIGDIRTVPLKSIGRYRPNKTASDAGSAVDEYVMVIERNPDTQRLMAGAKS